MEHVSSWWIVQYLEVVLNENCGAVGLVTHVVHLTTFLLNCVS